ncbi:MAG TPA: PAS domain-containing protein, partial [Pyrinomonadaceae bacterium]|nr:PAS domain-containing protein [Pyrinomonadaceae bacterium]
EVEGRPLHYFVHHTKPDGTPFPLEECPIDRALPENNQEQGEDIFVHKGGHFYPVFFTASPIREGGVVVGTVIEVRDTTEERRAREQLSAAAAHQASILDRIADGFMAFDTEWCVTYINRQAAQLVSRLEKSTDELTGRNIWEVFPDLVGSTAYEEYHRAMAEQVTVNFELYYPPLDSWFDIRVYPSPDGLSVYFQDVTERKRVEENLAERERAALLSADVGLALTEATGIRGMLQLCAESVVRHLDAAFARVWTLGDAGDVLELQASAGMYTHLNGPHGRVPVGKFKIGLIAAERKPHLTNSVVGDPRVGDQQWARQEGMVAFAGYPLVVDERLVGVLAMFSRQTLSDAVLQALGSVAREVGLGIVRKRMERERDRLQREVIEAQQSLLAELSTPLIPIREGIVVMPLIGAMNGERAAQMLEVLLRGVTSGSARVAILDVTGVNDVDTHVADMLMRAARSVRLLGAEVVITGIRSRVAQVLVELGADFHEVETRRNLQGGIEYAERLIGRD